MKLCTLFLSSKFRYDIVDRLYDQVKATFEKIVKISDLIIVANLKQQELVNKYAPGKHCSIMADGIDYLEQLDITPVPFNPNVVGSGTIQEVILNLLSGH